MSEKIFVIPPARVRYLSEISESNRAYDKKVDDQVSSCSKIIWNLSNIRLIYSTTHQSLEIITKTGLMKMKYSNTSSKDDNCLL